MKFQVQGGERWGGVGVRGWEGCVGKIPEFPGNFREFSRDFRDDRELQHGLV